MSSSSCSSTPAQMQLLFGSSSSGERLANNGVNAQTRQSSTSSREHRQPSRPLGESTTSVAAMGHPPIVGPGSGGGGDLTSNHLLLNNDCATSIATSLSDDDAPAKQENFMVSFLVDARGGSMQGCRYSGVKVTIPPKCVPQPMRITCRYVKTENLLYPPILNEGEGLASRILQVGPVGSKFLGPVLIEVPHVSSLRKGRRETAILRCESAAVGKWVEHRQDEDCEKRLKNSLLESNFSSPSSSVSSSPSHIRPTSSKQHEPPQPWYLEKRPEQQIVRIVTSDFPQYFAVVSRCRQEVQPVGPESSVLASMLLPRAMVHIPPKALNKSIDIGLSVQKIEDDVVEEILVQGGAVSPIVTIEPRRRKFHKAITVTMPLPERLHPHQQGTKRNLLEELSISAGSTSLASSRKTSMDSVNKIGQGPVTTTLLPAPPEGLDSSSKIETSLKLVCSMSANHHRACWEDVTNETPLTFANGCVQFTSIVSASFWLIECPNWMSSDVMSLVDQLYKSTMRVPYMARFFVYARRFTCDEVSVRILCLTEPERAENPLELQEDFKEVCRSEYVEVFDKSEVHIKFGGNLVTLEPGSAAGHHLISSEAGSCILETPGGGRGTLRFRPFFECREAVLVRRRNDNNPYAKGKVVIFTGVDNLLFEAKIDLTKFTR